MGRRGLVLPRAALSLALAARVAGAQEPQPPPGVRPPELREPAFGAPGQWVITGASNFGISRSVWDSGATYFSATFSPGLDYFFVRNVSVGGDVNASYSDGKGFGADSSLVETTSTTISGGPRMGVNVPLAERLSLYPRATVGFEWIHRDQRLVAGSTLSTAASPLGYPSTSQAGPWVRVYVPLLVHVVPHFFLGAGPDFFHDLGSTRGGPNIGGQRTWVGGYFLVGGTWGGRHEAFGSAESIAPPIVPRRRFGDAHEVVLDSEILAEGFWTTYAGTKSSALSASLEPSLDYFVADHVSLGLAPSMSYSRSTGIDPNTGSTVTYEFSGWAIEPRVGFDVRCAQWLSWYPRLGIAFGANNYDETSGTSENKYLASRMAIHAYAPLLVHPAQQLFAGLGPSFSIDLSDAFTNATGYSQQNRNRAVGLGLVVGGWL